MRYTCVAAATLLCTLASAADKLNILNVAALDHEGQPVTGLQTADFQLLTNGKPQTIAFSHFTGEKPLPATPSPKPGPLEYSNHPATAMRATVVLIDLLSDRLMSGAVIGDELTRAVKNFESSEGLYLYILTSGGALYPVHPLPNLGTEVTPAAEPWTRNIAPMLQAAFKDVFGFRPVDDLDIKVRFDQTARAMRELGAQMRLLSGRKSLVWVTHGVPIIGPSISEQGRVDFTNPWRLLCEQLEQAQIVVYPVAESMKGAGEALVTESEETLADIASLTGGRKYESGAVGEAIQQAVTDSRANYQIAYYAAEGNPDGKHHRLRVICARKEVRLQTVPGFYAILPQIRPADAESNAFVIAAHSPFDATEIGLRASVSREPGAGRNMRVDIHIDPADLLLRQAQNRRTGKIALLFAAYGAAGLEQQGTPIPIDISLTPEQYETASHSGIELHQAIQLSAAARRIRAIVVDRELGAAGSVTIPIQPSSTTLPNLTGAERER